MGRRKKEVNRNWLIECIRKAEENGPIESGVVALYQEVAELYNAGNVPEPITHSVVGLRIKDWKLPHQTTLGKRGNNNLGNIRSGTRSSTAEKFSENSAIVEHFATLRERTPKEFHNLIDQSENGSRTAAVKLNCLECSGFVRKEVRLCQCEGSCSLWAFRPYQSNNDED